MRVYAWYTYFRNQNLVKAYSILYKSYFFTIASAAAAADRR